MYVWCSNFQKAAARDENLYKGRWAARRKKVKRTWIRTGKALQAVCYKTHNIFMQRYDTMPSQARAATCKQFKVGLDGTQGWKDKAEEVPILPPPHVMWMLRKILGMKKELCAIYLYNWLFGCLKFLCAARLWCSFTHVSISKLGVAFLFLCTIGRAMMMGHCTRSTRICSFAKFYTNLFV